MAIEYEGKHVAESSWRFAIVVSRYNASITSNLQKGAVETLSDAGASEQAIEVFHVPGAWEIPLATRKLADTGKYDAIVCLGAVIRGETTHDQYINQQVSHTLGQISQEFQLPVSFGILTCNSMEQAIHRSGGNVGNKGIECAQAALEMIHLLKQIN